MLLAYADESFSKRYFFIVAIIATPEQVLQLTRALDSLVHDLAGTHDELGDREELHAHEVFQGKAAWKALYPRQRVKVFVDVFDAIAASGVSIVVRGLDIEAQEIRYSQPYPPYTVVLTKIFEAVQSRAKADDDLALLICDEYHEDDRHRKLLATYREWRTPTSARMRLDRILDTIHYTPSHESRMIQATDMVAFIRLRKTLGGSRDQRELDVIAKLWDTIRPNVAIDYVWKP